MDFLTGKIRPIYFKYLTAAFGSALITSIYSMVDMAAVGKYQDRTAQRRLPLLCRFGILFTVWGF